jgi:plastocyanin
MNKNRTLFSVLLMLTASMLLVFSGCSGVLTTTPVAPSSAGPGTNPPPATSVPPVSMQPPGKVVTIDLITQNMAFDKSGITVPAGAQVTINFNNKDKVGHNFAAYTSEAATTSIFIGQIITGPSTITYTFTAPAAPGTYFFRCDPHANFMKGQFIVQ